MSLNISEWKPFITSKLFYDLQNGKANQQMLEEGNECFYVGAKKDDNGVMIHCLKNEKLMTKGNCLVFICNGQGSVGYANYMDVDFIGTTDIVAGYNDNLNSEVGAFLATIYSQERPKYSFGRKWKTKLADTIVNLPIKHNPDGTPFIDKSYQYSDEGFVPDWQFMEDYIKSLHHKPLTTKNRYKQILNLNVENWKYVLLKDICKITMGNKMDALVMTSDKPEVNFVGRSADNNGVACKVDIVYDNKGERIEPYPAGCITVALGGSLGSTFLQKEPFYTSQNVSVLEFSNNVSDAAKLFICTLIYNESKYKYFPFGRELNTHIRTDYGFTIPVTSKNEPDWEFMENYMKSLPYGDRI
jgi:hypothetical protein